MNKHAFLIMAHDHFNILKLLLSQLDHELNDIYIHIDRKSGRIDENQFRRCCHKSRIVFIPRRRVYWGHSSIVECELDLLEAALTSGESYSYLHLLSGVDLQIADMKDIHQFFVDHPNRQFLAPRNLESGINGIKYYSFFLPVRAYSRAVAKGLNMISLGIQRLFHVNRLKQWNDIELMKTQQWFSITKEFASYVVDQRDFIHQFIRFTSCSDEMVMGTVLINSPYRSELWRGSPLYGHLRLIDRIRYEKASPHTWTIEDWPMIERAKNCFWARKFDETRDEEIIKKVMEKWAGNV